MAATRARDGIGGRVDGWADASSNVLPVIERCLKADGSFGVPLCSEPASQTPMSGTWSLLGPFGTELSRDTF